MNFYPFVRLKIRSVLILFAGIVITVALFLASDPKLSWAAPEQNPHLQTVPPRDPEETPVPDPPPPTSPDLGSRTDSNEDDNDEEGGDILLPTRTPGEAETGQTESSKPDNNDEVSPAKVSQPESGTQNQGKPSDQSSSQGNKDNEAPATPQQADLSLLKQVDNPTPKVGETITFTTIIRNSGPSRATNVIIRNSLPLGLVLSSTLASRGNYEADKGLWTISTIARSERVTMSLVVRVAEADPITITAEVVAIDQFDPDSIPNNNLEIEDDQASASITPSVDASLTTQHRSDLIGLGATPPPTQETLALSSETDWLYWLYALIIGIVFIFIGVHLIHRS